MVTKGYRKGVYERVTLGIRGWNRRLGAQFLLYKLRIRALVQMGHVAGVRPKV